MALAAQMRQIHGSAGPLSHELYLAPEVRMWDNFEPHHHTTGDLLRPAGDAEVLATDIWTLGVVFWQMLTLHLVKTLGAIPAVRDCELPLIQHARPGVWQAMRAYGSGSKAQCTCYRRLDS